VDIEAGIVQKWGGVVGFNRAEAKQEENPVMTTGLRTHV
jgi:hypothetical protein